MNNPGTGTDVNTTNSDSYGTIKLVASFLLNLLEALSGTTPSGDVSSPAAVDIEERRVAAASVASSDRFKQFLALLDQSGLPSLAFSALGQVVEAVKAHIEQSRVTVASSAGEPLVETSSLVISKTVSEGLECEEQLLGVSEQYVLLRAVSGGEKDCNVEKDQCLSFFSPAFSVDLLPFVGVAQGLLDMVQSFTSALDIDKNGA